MKKLVFALTLVLTASGCSHFLWSHSAQPSLEGHTVSNRCSSNTECAETYYMIAQMHEQDGDVKSALNAMKKAVSYDHSSPYLYLSLAKLYAEGRAYGDALAQIDAALKIDPYYIPALYDRADIESKTGKTAQAIATLKQVVTLSPVSENAYIALALTQYHANDTTGAKDTLNSMILHIPSSPYPYYYLAKIAVDQKKYKEAIAYYQDAVKASPAFSTALYEEADIYAFLKEYDKAVAVYNSILQNNPDEYDLYEKIGDLYLTAKQYTSALESYRKAQIYVSSLALQLKVGMVYIELKQYKAAEAVFKTIIASNPSFYRAYYYYGILLAENKKDVRAIEAFRKIPPENVIYPDAMVQVAIIYSNQKKSKEAENTLLPVLKTNPTVDLYNLYASFFAQDKDYKQAVGVLNKALNKFTDSQSLLYHLGVVYDQWGDAKDAISVMEQILKINRKNADALNYIGYTYADKGIKLDAAETMIKKALKIRPNDGFITDSLGWVYYKKGHLKEAIATLRRAVKLSKGDPQILEHLGDAYLKAGDKAYAIKTYRKAIISKQLKDKKLRKKLQAKLLELGVK